MKLIVRNLACPCCIIVVQQICAKQGLLLKDISYGHLELQNHISEKELGRLNNLLQEVGLEIINDPKRQLVELVKTLILAKVHEANIERRFVLSAYLKKNTLKDYSTLTKLFSATEGTTLEQYFIQLKMQKAKELLAYKAYSVKQVATALGYSSAQHFAVQFKKAFGVCATACQPGSAVPAS